MRAMIGTVAMLVAGFAALLLSAAAHLDSAIGRRALADLLERWIDREIQGSIVIGAIDEVSADRVRVRDVLVRSPAGRPALRLDRATLDPAPRRLLSESAIALESARVEGARLWMIEDRDGLRLEQAFESPSSGGGDGGLRIDLRAIVFQGLASEWRIGSSPPFTIEEASGILRVRTDSRGEVTLRFDRIEGLARFDLPIVDPTVGVRAASGRVRAGARRVAAFDIELDVAGEPLEVALDLVESEGEIAVYAETGTDRPGLAWLALLGVDRVAEIAPGFRGDITPAGAIGTDRPARRRGDPRH